MPQTSHAAPRLTRSTSNRATGDNLAGVESVKSWREMIRGFWVAPLKKYVIQAVTDTSG